MNTGVFSKSLLLAACIGFCSASVAGIYKYTDENGNTIYTDKPSDGAERVKIRNESKAPRAPRQKYEPAVGEARGDRSDQLDVIYSKLEILTPKNDSTAPGNSGNVDVVLLASPRLHARHRIVIALDGKEISNGRHANLSLTQLSRGTHTLTAQIVDAEGSTQIQADAVSFHVKRPVISKDSPLAFDREEN
jgi:hypothetical protein